MSSEPIRVAIIGGGIGGLTLARGLLQYPHIKFDVFEGKPTFSERGVGVAIAPNAQNALRAMNLDADQLLKDSGGVHKDTTTCFMAHGPHKGEKILVLPPGVYVVDRVAWLDTLLKDIPQSSLHANKKLSSIDETAEGPYTLHFSDETTHTADIVIGSDGIRSKMRQIVLGPSHQDKWAPVFGGYWDARGRMSLEQVTSRFGSEIASLASANMVALVGDGAFMLFAAADHGKTFYVIVSAVAGEKYDRSAWKMELSREFLEEQYGDWDEQFREGMIEALMAEDSGPGVVFSEWQSAETPVLVRGKGLCIMGDAAHATLPWMGQGAAQSTEDACILSNLLGLCHDPSSSDLPAAMNAYNATRRSRPEYVIERSAEAAKMLTGQMGMDPKGVAHLDAIKWWERIRNVDMFKEVEEARRVFEEGRGARS